MDNRKIKLPKSIANRLIPIQPNKIYDFMKPWRMNKSVGKQLHEWTVFNTKNENLYPVRWYIFETVPKFFRQKFFNLDQEKWKVLHKYHPKHRYHMIDTGLPPGYYDPVELIPHAMFKLVIDYYNDGSQFVEWEESSEAHKEAYIKMGEVKDFSLRYPDLQYISEPSPEVDHSKLFHPDHQNDLETLRYQKWVKREHEKSDNFHRELDEMLIKIIEIRRFLWY